MSKKRSSKRNIYYLCHGASESKKEDFKFLPSAVPVIEYVTDCMHDLGCNVKIVSAYMSENGFQRYEKDEDGRVEYIYLPSLGNKTLLGKRIGIRLFYFEILIYLISHIRKDDILLVYHSIGFIKIVETLLKLKRVRSILQIEEYYSYVNMERNRDWKYKELQYFAQFDNFIFVNDVIKEELNHKRGCVLYGPYRISGKFREQDNKNEQVVKIIYAGGITKTRAAEMTAMAAEYLPNNYSISIIGYGDETCILSLKKIIDLQNEKAGFEKVVYGGFLTGNEYDEFLSKYDIGVSLYESPAGETEDATKYMFSSKIMSYLSHGLYVVASETTSLMNSSLLDVVEVIPKMNPKEVADSILRVDIQKTTRVFDRINELDCQFRRELEKVISEV